MSAVSGVLMGGCRLGKATLCPTGEQVPVWVGVYVGSVGSSPEKLSGACSGGG